ncbi:MAG TPA: amino acid adenylation domain-containing protein [Pseudonocardiaceae bacterium]
MTHHVVSDGWSRGVLVRELGEVYLAESTGRRAVLPALPIQYADYAAWQRDRLAGQWVTDELDWWRRALAGAPDLLDLPTDAPRPAVQSFRGATIGFDWPAELTEQLRAIAREHDATLFMVLLAGFAATLARYTRQDDVVVGTPVAGRTHPELEGLIGLFVNTLVLRTPGGASAGFGALLDQVRRTCLDAFAHQDLPFERLVDALRPDRSLSHSPVVQVFFDLQNTPAGDVDWPGLRMRPFAGGAELLGTTAKFDLSVSLRETPSGLEGTVEYNTDLFTASTVRRLAGHYRTLLADAVSRPGEPLRTVSMMTGAERDLVLAAGTPATPTEPGPSLPDLIERHARTRPDAIAVASADRSLTYGALNAAANRLARLLRERGVGPERRVGVLLRRSPDLIVALLAVLKAGGAYVPVDPDHPRERQALVLADAGAVLVIADSVRDAPDVVPVVVPGDASPERYRSEDLPRSAAGDNLAYVIYTSGSTGLPKGVQVTNRNLAAACAAWQHTYQLRPEDRHLQMASATFDVFTGDLTRALGSGAALVLCPRELLLEPERLAELADAEAITCAEFVPVVLRHVITALRGRSLPALRLLVSGADAWPLRDHLRAAEIVGAGGRVVNSYGLTEATIDNTWFESAQPGEGPDGALAPIGAPLGHTRAYVLDRAGRLAPVGVPGELCLGGDAVTRGYLGQPARTAERFVPDPFGPAGARLYRTGDLARLRPDGALEFLGRVDHQVKIRGHRVEPGEVEAVLTAHPDVTTAVVVARTDSGPDARLVAYVAVRGGAVRTGLAEALRAKASDRLPPYLVPAAVVLLDQLPLTPNGKIDRRALPAPPAPARGVAHVPPATPAEQAVARVWADVLGLPDVGAEANFFGLGGDSIISLQVVARLRAEGWTVTPKQLFEHQTVRALAAAARPRDATEPPPAEQGVVTGAVPLTPIQAALLIEQRPPRPHHYNQAVMLRARHAVRPETVERALRDLLRHHDALRLRVWRTERGWQQEQAGLAGLPDRLLEIVDLHDVPAPERADRIADVALRTQTSLDLASGCLLAATYFDLGADGCRLLLVVHHLAVDGVSWRILLADLDVLLDRGAAALPPKTTPFRDWARHLTERAHSAEIQAEAGYWAGLAGDSAVPVDFPVIEPPTVSTVDVVRTVLAADETSALLREVPAAYHTRINDVLLAALGQALGDWLGSRQVLVELESHGRDEAPDDYDLSRTVGWFTSVHPVLLDLGPDDPGDPGTVLKRIKQQQRVVPHNGIGHGLLRHLAADPAAGGDRPQVAFNYLGQFDGSFQPAGWWEPAPEPAGPMHDPDEPRENLLDVTAAVSGGRLEVAWGYSTTVHRQETVEALAASFLTRLRELIAHCVAPGAGGWTPSDFPLITLGQADLDRVLAGRDDIVDVYPLTPMQEGMVFHSAHGGGAYVEQFSCLLGGPLDSQALRTAWAAVVERHTVLRTSVHWAGIPAPVQVVHGSVSPEWTELDLRGVPAVEQDARLELLLAEDRALGFVLDEPPLLRFTLVRLAGREHRFVFSHHHLLLDGWSFPRVVGEAFHRYEALVRGEAPVLPPVRPFRDYLAWLGKQDQQGAERYWRDLLADYVPAIPARAAAAGEPGCREVTLAEPASLRLVELARTHHVTLNTVVQAAWAILTARRLGTDDVVFGMTVSGRPADLPGVDDIVGLLINTVPVRANPSAGVSVGHWLGDLQRQLTESRQHDHVPLARIHGLSPVPRDVPLFDSLVVFENYPASSTGGGDATGLRVRDVHTGAHTNYPLNLAVAPGARLHVQLWHDRTLFDDAAAQTLLEQFTTVLDRMTSTPACPVTELDVVPDAQRLRVLREWGRTQAAEPEYESVPEAFAAQAARTPDATALVHADGEVTYRELDARANRLAHRLRAAGVGPEDRVALLRRRSVELVVATLAVLKAGAAYVPLDERSPDDRLAAIVRRCGAKIVLTDAESAHRAVAGDVETLVHDEPSLAGFPATAPEVRVRGAGLAYVMYTSGSTGTPKGVAATHADVVALAADRCWRNGAHERVPLHSPHAFDAATYELWTPLLSGGQVVVAPPGELSVDELAELIATRRLTGLFLTIGLFRVLAELRPAALRGVREVWTGGDIVPADVVRRVLDACPGLAVIDVYGPTETTTFATYHRMTTADEVPETVPIGRPLDGMSALVLDAALRVAPPGAVGQLYLAGTGLARGYLGQSGLTAERFVPDPYGPVGSRMYRTGDLARWTAGGVLEFVGRTDGQVKVRGFRVETGEVEAALRARPSVREALVVARPDRRGGHRLIAYVVGEDDGLLAYCRSVLPDYMVPDTVVPLAALPLTANGKLDRAALPDPAAPVAAATYVAPQTPVQSVIAGVWQDVLGVARVGAHDSFFELGGHSMVALRLVDELNRVLGGELSLTDLYRHPTPEGIATALAAPAEDWPRSIIPLRAGGSRPPLFCVHPKNGTVFCFTSLARVLDDDRPVHGVQAHSLELARPPHESIEEMATAYVADIRRVQPAGPYHLCGYSLGGLIVYEMARQLTEAGQAVEELVLLDSSPDLGPDFPTLTEFDAMDDVRFLVSEFADNLDVTEPDLRALPEADRLPHIMALADAAGLLAEHMDLRTMGRYVDIARAHTRAALAYQPRPYGGAGLLLRCADPKDTADSEGTGASAPNWGWGDLLRGGLDIRVVPGTHITMLDPPHLDVLAGHLRTAPSGGPHNQDGQAKAT